MFIFGKADGELSGMSGKQMKTRVGAQRRETGWRGRGPGLGSHGVDAAGAGEAGQGVVADSAGPQRARGRGAGMTR